MKSKSFTNHDIKNNKTKKKLQLFFIEEYCPQYKDINLFNQTIDNDKLLEQIEKDLNRRLNLFIHDSNSAAVDNITNVVESMKERITKDSLSTSDLCQELQSTYRLSLGQANYIAISSTQGGIGGCYPSDIIAKIKPDVTMLINKPGTLSQIIIDEDNHVQYIGGQVILFDQSIEKWSEVLNKSVGIENYLLEKSTDQVILYVTINLGPLGQDITTRPEVRIDVAGAGIKGYDFIKQLRSIKTKCNNTAAAEIKLNYITLSDFTIYKNKSDERCELALRTEQIWYEIDLTASASSSESLSVEQMIHKSNIDACLKTRSTFYVSMDSLQDFVGLEGDNTNTNKLSSTFSFLTQCILSSDTLSLNQEQESYEVSSDFIPITKPLAARDSKIVPHAETSIISLGGRITVQDSNQEECYSQAQVAKIVKYIIPQEGNRLAIIESISQLEKFLNSGDLMNKPDINIILYNLNAIYWVTFCITKLPEEIIILYKDSLGNVIPEEIKESITQCFNDYPVRFAVHREQEQNDRSSGGPMAIRNIQIILQGLQQNKEEFIHQFTQTKFCTQQDVAQYKEIFDQLSISSSQQDLAIALKQDNNSSIIIRKKLLEGTKHLDIYLQEIKKDKDYVALVKIQNHENFIQHLNKYYEPFLGSQLLNYLIISYSYLGESGNQYILEDIQYYLVTVGNIPVIDWLIRYEKLDPLLLLDNAIYHYALPASDQATKSRMCTVIQHILTDDKITNYFTLQNIQALLHQFTNPKINESYSLDSNNVRTILSFIDSVIQENWSKKLIELFHPTTNNHINNAEQISVPTLGSEEENLANTLV